MSRPRTLVQAAAVALVALLTAATAGTAVATPVPSSSGPLSQRLDPNQGTGHGHVVLSHGHVDIGPRQHDGAWSIAIHDDTKAPSLWRAPDDVVIAVGDAAELTAPTTPTYRFLGAAAGQQVWVIPQTQNRDVVWTGWNTQDPAVMSELSLGATFTFHGVTGPGQLFVFLQSGLAGAPDQLWSSAKPAAQKLFVETNTHTHANWVFTKPGIYLVDMEISAKLRSGRTVTDRRPLRFAVGSATDPQRGFGAATASPTPSAGSTSGAPSVSAAPSASTVAGASAGGGGGGGTAVWIAVPVAAVLLGGVVFLVALRQRRLRRDVHGTQGAA